ncbi:restriction endonuclease subunit S [Acinetobacter vivianii]|uniref:Restriction endonuclease subunit S n=1 Tax=Acinetobacter vivianii TaxID=1776742 RepID=A0AAJ6P5Y7_9GAMM|nr:restriction endonuclease subunit S [Acinetobacter vivianii]WDZ51910.1 restriction endonuclease subunit S [Acinetobacter vivianii]
MSWQKVKLGELIDNFSVRAKDIGGAKNLEFYGVSNEVGITASKYSAEDKAEDYKIIEKGCFAYNPYRVNVGSIGLFKSETKGLISPAYVVFKPRPNAIKAELLLRFLKSAEGLRQVKLYARGTVRQALRFEDLCNIELSIPHYDEQEEIEVNLQNLFARTQAISIEQETQLAYLRHLRQQILSDAIQGKLDLPHTDGESGEDLLARIKAEKAKTTKKEKTLPEIKADDIPFDIPEHWVWCRLGEICRVKVGATPSRSEPKYWKGDIPWVASGEVANNYISDTKEKISQEGFNSTSLTMYPKGSVLVAMIGQGKTRGQTAVLKIDATTNQNVAGLVIEHKYLLSEYLWYFFLSRYETTRSGASGGNQPALNGIKISNTLFPLPPMSEQIELVRKMDNLMALCDELEASIRQNQEYTQMLYQTTLREALQKPA